MDEPVYSRSSGEQGFSGSSTATLLSQTGSIELDTFVEKDEQRSPCLQFSPLLLLLTFLVVLVTAGLDVIVIIWFAKHSHRGGLIALWEEGAFLLDEGAFLLDEGAHFEGNSVAARLTGLTIALSAVRITSILPFRF